MASQVKTVGIVGTGVIGSSWIALFLSHGAKVVVADPGPDAEQKLQAYLEETWPSVPKNSTASLENLTFVGPTLTKEHLQTVDFIQENAPERLDFKRKLFASLDADTPKHVPICSSSSGLVPSSFMTDCANAPERVLVGHPYNPPHLIPLVEIVPHSGTSDAAIATAKAVYESISRRPIVLRKEVPGFVGNRLQAAVMKEAVSLVANGICDPEDVDAAMTHSLGPRWAITGPFLTSIYGAGGNPGGYARMQEHLGDAFYSWTVDMDERAKNVSPEKKKEVIAKVEAGLGKVNTKELEKQRDEVLVNLFKDRAARDDLENYANKQ